MSMKIFPATLTQDQKKIPLIKGWEALASDDPLQIKTWQEFYRDRLSFYGVPCGPNDLLVLDVDTKIHNGFKTIEDLNKSGFQIPPTMSQKTLNGGQHFIFKYPKDGWNYTNKVGFLPGLDIRSKGGWIAWYGSNNLPPADAPAWLLEKIRAEDAPISTSKPIAMHLDVARGVFEKCLESIAEASEGERNHVLNTQSFKVGQLLVSSSLPEDFAVQEMTKIAKSIGLSDSEIRATIRSGLKGGKTSPLTCPFGDTPPAISISIPPIPIDERWTPRFMTKSDLLNVSSLRKPQLFKDWSTEDIHITTADGGTGKTTLKLYEAICLALGERFLGFDCKQAGRTLFITGEDTASKLSAMIGAIVKQMGLLTGTPETERKIQTILNSIVIKKDSDLCLITKTKDGFIRYNPAALNKVLEAIEDLKPKMIVFDPISSFWGSEAALNDMNKAVVNFMQRIQEGSNACVEMINHMGKVSSQSKDMTQFAGRGGTGLPSHSRVSRVMRSICEDEYRDLTGEELNDKQSAMLCVVNKFSDGSPLLGKPFLIVREGFLFYRKNLTPQKQKEQEDSTSDMERVFEFIKEARLSKRYATKPITVSYFKTQSPPLSEARVKRAIDLLMFGSYKGELVKYSTHPDAACKERVLIIEDQDGNEKY